MVSARGGDVVRFVFRDECELNISSWVSALRNEIASSSSNMWPIPRAPTTELCKSLHIREKAFRKLAMSGDLVLFAGKSVMNKVQRLVTGSRFDHVALLVRDRRGGLQVLEATGSEVCLYLMILRNYRESLAPAGPISLRTAGAVATI